MSILTTILIFVFLPFNYYFAGLLDTSEKISGVQSQVQGVSDSKNNEDVPAENSLKGTLTEKKTGDKNYGGSGYLPERKEGYSDIKISSSASVVVDVDSGTILHYEEGRLHMPIASLTKMMTAVLIMEKVKNLDEEVTIDEEATLAEGTKVGCPRTGYCIDERLHEGEKVTAKDLLTAMLLNSANDAAVAFGNHIAGSQKEFARLMNEKAQELNLSDTHFCNPSGLDEDGCYSSAYDLARIAAYSMKYDLIWKIVKMQEAEISSCDGKYTHNLKNTDLLLGQLPNCLGGKTGFTYNAGKSLMMAAADPAIGKHKIIAVILNDENRWNDMTNLINWTFENYDWR
jgi:serine-type D-Ala-D-Ala carboxypeptidase (penicillin-binding protein 5/6)